MNATEVPNCKEDIPHLGREHLSPALRAFLKLWKELSVEVLQKMEDTTLLKSSTEATRSNGSQSSEFVKTRLCV